MPTNDGIPTHGEILYKLGQIESEIKAWNSTWGDAIKRIENQISLLATKVDNDNRNLEHRVVELERQVSTWKTRLYTVAAVISTGWVLLGDAVHRLISKVF